MPKAASITSLHIATSASHPPQQPKSARRSAAAAATTHTIIYPHYNPTLPFTTLAYSVLEQPSALPITSIPPAQALSFMNPPMHLPLKDALWDSMIDEPSRRKPGVQDEGSLGTLTQCIREGDCKLPKARITAACLAALSRPDPDARFLAMYGDYAWNILDNHDLGLRMTEAAVKLSPDELAYQITRVRNFAVERKAAKADAAIKHLQTRNIGNRPDDSKAELRKLPNVQ